MTDVFGGNRKIFFGREFSYRLWLEKLVVYSRCHRVRAGVGKNGVRAFLRVQIPTKMPCQTPPLLV